MATRRYLCVPCREAGVQNAATYLGAQSVDQGETVTHVRICQGHAETWNDGSDWDAPVVPLKSG